MYFCNVTFHARGGGNKIQKNMIETFHNLNFVRKGFCVCFVKKFTWLSKHVIVHMSCPVLLIILFSLFPCAEWFALELKLETRQCHKREWASGIFSYGGVWIVCQMKWWYQYCVYSLFLIQWKAHTTSTQQEQGEINAFLKNRTFPYNLPLAIINAILNINFPNTS